MPDHQSLIDVRAALDRADEDLSLLDSVPVADTQAAKNAMTGARVEALERFRGRVREAVGSPEPPAAA
jgi:hypothetical protein